jgi:hypothetical protein
MYVRRFLLLVAWPIAATCAHAPAGSADGDGQYQIDTDGTVRLSGRVLENVRRCDVDLSCYLVVRSGDREFEVTYAAAEGEPCENDDTARAGWAVRAGQTVAVYGSYTKGEPRDRVSTCPRRDFYIKVEADAGPP